MNLFICLVSDVLLIIGKGEFSMKYTALQIQFQCVKCPAVTMIGKHFEQFFIPMQAMQASKACRCKQTTSEKCYKYLVQYIHIQIVQIVYINSTVADK